MKSNINVSNLTSVYNVYNCSFNTTLRFIIETASADRVAVPATPTKDMTCEAARECRAEIRRAKNVNRAIDDCTRICATLGITAASLKKAPAKALREAVLARLPYVAAATGHAVVKYNLPVYLTDEHEGVFGVRAASWLEAARRRSRKYRRHTARVRVDSSPRNRGGEVDRGRAGCRSGR